MSILVTGASRGIGKAILECLLKNNVNVIGTTTDLSKVDQSQPNTTWLEVDFNQDKSFNSFIDKLRNIGSISGIVNNVGINIIKDLSSLNSDDLFKVVNVNLLRPFQIVSKLHDVLLDGGKIVNIASIWSVVSREKRTMYSSAKAGITGMTRSMAVELGPRGILVNTVSPGFVLTDLTKESLSKQEISELENKIPMKKMAQPFEIAEVVNFLVSPKNSYLTGQNIVVDGGYTIV